MLCNRLDAIAADAELQEKSMSDLELLANLLHTGCEEAYNLQQQIATENDAKDIKTCKDMFYSLIIKWGFGYRVYRLELISTRQLLLCGTIAVRALILIT